MVRCGVVFVLLSALAVAQDGAGLGDDAVREIAKWSDAQDEAALLRLIVFIADAKRADRVAIAERLPTLDPRPPRDLVRLPLARICADVTQPRAVCEPLKRRLRQFQDERRREEFPDDREVLEAALARKRGK